MIRAHQLRRAYRILPLREQVTYRSRTAEGTFTETEVGDADFRAIDKTAGSPHLAQQTSTAMLFQQPLEAAGSITPKVNDELRRADGSRWTIEALRWDIAETYWELTVRRVV